MSPLRFILLLGCLAGASTVAARGAAEPALPAGLQPRSSMPKLPAGLGDDGPKLPSGLGNNGPQLPSGLQGGGPPLPRGLVVGGAPPAPGAVEAPASQSWRISGFVEGRGGVRVQAPAHERRTSLTETRLQLEIDKEFAGVSLRGTADLLIDPVADSQAVDLETGNGFLDLREASAVFSPTGFSDVKVGRQILTWGTGDLLFINDLFPKDWNSFLLGRNEEYLKAPSDAVKLSVFSGLANLDVVYTPSFDADRYIDGRRVSFFNPGLGRISGRDAIVAVDRPDDWFTDDEWALRLYRNFGPYEGAVYGYDGYWKSPAGSNPASGRATFPRLSVLGGSLRGPLGNGIAAMEAGYYDSRDDRGGGNQNVANSEFRLLLSYEQEIARNLTLGVQYYLERLLDYDEYQRTLPPGTPERDEYRQVLTQRLTWLTLKQNLEWSLFAFLSPSDADAYLRPRVKYKVSDSWSLEAGGNIFFGRDNFTFFGQLEDNSNAYVAARYGF